MEKTFQTGSFSFRLRFPEELVLPADMEKFAVEKESEDEIFLWRPLPVTYRMKFITCSDFVASSQ